ncbi:MAG TPA: head decoration protein [Aurantimonas coralicida]|uniref:Head decoration protein n=2 Tax=root TaxID=1 RepID=A0A9C9NGQ1_9HYPH|nr:head decoration protein [Aurantimonas coralicida]HEU01000.1 head decoration protein [Aurantimonas coralicida]
MLVKTEARHTAEFILSEGPGGISRDNGTVLKGQKLKVGEVVQKDGAGKLIAADGNLTSAGDVQTEVAGIVIDAIDASATGADADVAAAYIARLAEVNNNLLTYPAESTAGGEKAAVNASLAKLFIIAR